MSSGIVISSVHINTLNINVGSFARSARRYIEVEFVPIFPNPTENFHLVSPVSGNSGTICATIQIDPEALKVIEEVKAYVYDLDIFTVPDPDSQPPALAVAGHAELGNRWSWGGASGVAEIPSAVHNSAGTKLNALAVWKRYQSESSFVYDGRLIFAGKTGGSGSCGGSGSGSGSGSSAGTRMQFAELHGAQSLDITIPDGKHLGVHKAKLRGHMLWEAKIADAKFAISMSACGKHIVLHTPKGALLSSEVAERPFKAIFKGDALSGIRTLIVTVS